MNARLLILFSLASLTVDCGGRTGIDYEVSPDGPRPMMPLSFGNVTTLRPTFKWQLPMGLDGAVIELCRDRACTMIIETVRAMGSSGRPTNPLPARSVVFWRLRGTVGMNFGSPRSATWLFHTPAVEPTGNVDSSANPHLDVNGDGFDDIAVGSSWADPGERWNAGTVSVYHGGPTGVSMVPARVFEGAVNQGRFGNAVASAGDVNGDGFSDLVVGSLVAGGTVSVYLGSAVGLMMSPARVLSGFGPVFAGFGDSIASAGDVNADGFGDLIIGDIGAATAYLYHGGPTGVSMVPARVLERISVISVASAGDLNGDGFSDIVIGNGGRMGVGTASVYHGGAMGVSLVPTRVLEGVAAWDGSTSSVASAGDVNGDGFSDLVVGSVAVGPTVNVYHGGATGVGMVPDRVLELISGWSVASAGDVNGDGFGDIITGDRHTPLPGGRAFAGTASVYHGGPMGVLMVPARVLEGVGPGDEFGSTVARAGDVNGDGLDDVIVGSDFASPGGRRRVGSASVFHGGATGVAMVPARVLEGVGEGDFLQHSIASGDLNGCSTTNALLRVLCGHAARSKHALKSLEVPAISHVGA